MSLFELFAVDWEENGQHILHIPRLQIAAGGIHCVLGAEKKDRTIFLQLLAKQVDDYAGRISWYGNDIRMISKTDYARHVQLVSHSPQLMLGSVRYNLEQSLRWYGCLAAGKQDLKVLLPGFDLLDKLHQPMADLSASESYRLRLIRALVLRPEVLILDDPKASLQAEQATLLKHYLWDAVRAGSTAIIATDDRDLVQAANNILLMVDGKFI